MNLQEKALCVIWLAETTPTVTLHRNFRRTCGRDRTVGKAFLPSFNHCDIISVAKCEPPGQPRTPEEGAERIRLRTYEIQTVHQVRNTDQCTRDEFANLMLNATGDDETVLGE
jgi:hypothetical protein